jgi:hypothetical protein
MAGRFKRFDEFYPFYLEEHQDRTCRRLHFVGSLLVLLVLAAGAWLQNWWALPIALVLGYGFAWIGHFAFEKNRPATFQYPLYSFMGDWVMFKDMLTGRIRF